MNKDISIIVTGPQGSGKQKFIQDLKERYPTMDVIDEWTGTGEIPKNAIIATNASKLATDGPF